jgi:hypothetical protein
MSTVTAGADMSKTLNQSGATGGSPNAGLRVKASTPVVTVPEGVTVSVTPVDSKTLEGSYPGDHRSQTVGASLPAQTGPRDTPQQSEVGPC